MKAVFKMLEDGGFVAGDEDSRMTAYAYPSSPHANVAKRYPKLVAEEMLEAERSSYRKIPAVQEHDRKNWLLLGILRHPENCEHPPEETCMNCRPWWGSCVSRNDL